MNLHVSTQAIEHFIPLLCMELLHFVLDLWQQPWKSKLMSQTQTAEAREEH
jgi:hypothetical protein